MRRCESVHELYSHTTSQPQPHSRRSPFSSLSSGACVRVRFRIIFNLVSGCRRATRAHVLGVVCDVVDLPRCPGLSISCDPRAWFCHLCASSNSSRHVDSAPSCASRAALSRFLAWFLKQHQNDNQGVLLWWGLCGQCAHENNLYRY